jgi:hypothetical protein
MSYGSIRVCGFTFEDIPHFTECFIFPSREKFYTSFQISNLRYGINKRRLDNKTQDRPAVAFLNGIRVERYDSGHVWRLGSLTCRSNVSMLNLQDDN